jgi:hypothetical protein
MMNGERPGEKLVFSQKTPTGQRRIGGFGVEPCGVTQRNRRMDADNLSLRLEALEASVAEYVVADLSRWQAVHARITAYEIAVELMCNVAQRRDPSLVRDLIEGLVFVETETRLTNFHDALIGEIHGIREKLEEQLEDLVSA